MACPLPGNVSKCLATPVYSVGGSDYLVMEFCDNNGKLLAVYELCNGAITGAPTYYTLAGAPYTPVGVPHSCESGDFEQFVFCDTATDPPTPFISRALWTENGDLVVDQTGTYALDGITPYTPVGPVAVCGGDVIDVELVGPLCEKDAAGNLVGYVWHKIFHRGQVQIATALAGYKVAALATWVDPYVLGAGNALIDCNGAGDSDTGITPMRDCTTGDPIFLVSVTAADGDVIPVDSTEFPAVAAGAGIFSTIGFYRSYYADTLGNYIDPQPTAICLPTNSSAPSVTVSLVCGVVGGASKPLIRRALVDSAGVETVTFLDVDGALVTPTTWTPGLCNNHLVSTIERLVGAGTITIPTNARSITVTVNAGTPTVQIGSSAAIGLVKNLSLTWGTDGSNEDLSDQFVFTGIAGSDFYVTTSRL